ncbi:MAG: thermonuclease family protein, partial [Vicinamibacterales bacterium]
MRRVLDGDTIDVGHAGRVRLLGIDAPELGIGFDTPAPFAAEARDRLASLLSGRYVRLETDGPVTDRYGRRLAYVFRDDGLFANAEMLRRGLALVSARRQMRRLSELRAAERSARVARLGIWGRWPGLPSERAGGLRPRGTPHWRELFQHALLEPLLHPGGFALQALPNQRTR